MEIRIDIDTGRPPAGRVRLPDGPPIRFEGSLALLGTLERLQQRRRIRPVQILEEDGDPAAGAQALDVVEHELRDPELDHRGVAQGFSSLARAAAQERADPRPRGVLRPVDAERIAHDAGRPPLLHLVGGPGEDLEAAGLSPAQRRSASRARRVLPIPASRAAPRLAHARARVGAPALERGELALAIEGAMEVLRHRQDERSRADCPRAPARGSARRSRASS